MHVSPAVDEGVDTHSHHMCTPNIALETSSHSRNNNIGRMMQKSELHKRVQKSELHKRDTGTYAASTPSSSAGDPCIFKSCPRLVRGHVHILGAWAPEFGLYAHRPQTCVIVRSDRSAGCQCRARRTPRFETWVTGSRELAMPSRRAASTRHF